MFCNAKYHFKKHGQLYKFVNIIQNLLISNLSGKYKFLKFISQIFIFRSHFLCLCKHNTCGMENANVHKNIIKNWNGVSCKCKVCQH